jgi:hypothetical protein
MKRWMKLSVCATLLLSVALLSGCGGEVMPLDLSNYQRIAIAPFSTEEESAEMERRFPLDLSTRLTLLEKEKEWIYDQSDTLSPIGGQLTAQNLTPKDIFLDSALAAKVGKAANADIIIVGHIKNPKMDEKYDSNPLYDMSAQAGISGTTKFVIVYQWATLNMQVKAIDTKSGSVIWDNGGFTGYTRYIREFNTQDPARHTSRVAPDQLKADIRKHMLNQIGHQLVPDKINARPVPEILTRPQRKLVRSGGQPVLW